MKAVIYHSNQLMGDLGPASSTQHFLTEVAKTMMRCNPKKLAKFVENKVKPEEKLDILFHLDNCPLCFNEIYRLKKLKGDKYYKSSAMDPRWFMVA